MKKKTTKRKITLILLPLIAALLFSVTAFGAVLNPTDIFYVNDYANVLSQDTIDYIVDQNLDLEGGSGAQIVVAVVNFTDGQPIEDYTADLFNRWGIGAAGKNNGVLLLLSIGDDDYYAVQGQGLEQVLTGGDIDDILFYNLEPDFDIQDYDAGVIKAFDALWDVVNKHYPAASTLGVGNTAGTGEGSGEERENAGFPILGLIVLIIIIAWLFRRRRRRRVVYHQPPVYGHHYRPRRRILTPRAHHHHHYHQHPPHFAPPPPRGRAPKPPKLSKPPKASKPAAAPKPQSTAAPKPSSSGGLFSGGGGSTRGGGAGRNSSSSSSRTSGSTPKPSSSSSRSSSTSSRTSSSSSRSSGSSSSSSRSSSAPRSGGGGSTRGGGAGRRK